MIVRNHFDETCRLRISFMGEFGAYPATRLKLAPALQRRRRRKFLAEDRLWPTAAKMRRQVALPMPVSFPSHTVPHRRIAASPHRCLGIPRAVSRVAEWISAQRERPSRSRFPMPYCSPTDTLIAYNGQEFHVAPCLSATGASFFLDTFRIPGMKPCGPWRPVECFHGGESYPAIGKGRGSRCERGSKKY